MAIAAHQSCSGTQEHGVEEIVKLRVHHHAEGQGATAADCRMILKAPETETKA